jgi:hypothetical protein
LLATRPIPKLEDPLSAVRGCLFNIFAAALHIGGRSSIRNMKTLHLSGGSFNTYSRNPKHAVQRNSASCKSVGSVRTDRLDESYVPSSSTNTSVSVSVSRHTTITFSTLRACISCHLFIGTVRHWCRHQQTFKTNKNT